MAFIYFNLSNKKYNNNERGQIMTGLKAQIKKYLRSNGINMITNDQGRSIRLGNAKTQDLLKVAVKHGF